MRRSADHGWPTGLGVGHYERAVPLGVRHAGGTGTGQRRGVGRVKQRGAPAGWFVNPSLVTGPFNGLAATAYWSCIGAQPAGNTVPVAGAGVAVTCTITNAAARPTLTLVEVVDNANTGVSTAATDWTLTAEGPTPFSGPTWAPAVTGAVVKVGSTPSASQVRPGTRPATGALLVDSRQAAR